MNGLSISATLRINSCSSDTNPEPREDVKLALFFKKAGIEQNQSISKAKYMRTNKP